VVDATCGNGNDTCLLAELVGPTGKVWAFDTQEPAIEATDAALRSAGVRERVELVPEGHERLAARVTAPVSAVVFNLGYLPGGDKGFVTRPESTRAALEQAGKLLGGGGLILAVVYTGHPGGDDEWSAVRTWAAALTPREFNVWQARQMNRSDAAPFLVVVEKRGDCSQRP
jgi:SAM-dependent methyltransferase